MSSVDFESNTTTDNTIETSTISSPITISIEFYLKIYDVFVPIIGFLIITLNISIVVTTGLILYNGKEPRTTYACLGNVAVADLIVGIIIIFSLYYPIAKRTEMICCALVGFNISSSLASVYSIMLIGIDRYLYIIHGLQYQNYLSMSRAKIAIIFIWIQALTLGFIPAMGYRNSTENGKYCWFTVLAPPRLVFALTAYGIIPLIIISVLYSIILQKALSKIAERKARLRNIANAIILNEEQVELNGDDSKRCLFAKYIRKKLQKDTKLKLAPVYNPSKWKAIKIVLFTTGCFFCTWFPFFFASTLFVLCDPSETPKYCDNLRIVIASPLAMLGVCNSILNPLIYAWFHNGFRESIKKMYIKFKRQFY